MIAAVLAALPVPVQTNQEKSQKDFISFQSSPHGEWKQWAHRPPTKETLEVLKRESDANHVIQLKRYLESKKNSALYAKEGKTSLRFPVPHALFYGEFVYSYRWAKGREWNVEKGWIKE